MNFPSKFIISIIIVTHSFAVISTPGYISDIFSMPLSAFEIAYSNAIDFENKSFSIIKNPIQYDFEKNVIGYNFNYLYSGEVSSSIFQFPRIQTNDFVYQYGGIFLYINDIPDTRDLFSSQDGLVPDYSTIKNINFNQYIIWLNYSKKINDKKYLGLNIFPHYYQLDDFKGYGLLANIGYSNQLTSTLNYSLIINSITGSFTYWENNKIEFFPMEIRNSISIKYNKIKFNSSLDYNSESSNIFSSNFWVNDGFVYSLAIKYIVNNNLELILSNGDMIYLGGGFVFEFKGIEIYYGVGNQKFDSITILHQGIDLIFDLNRINECQKILKP